MDKFVSSCPPPNDREREILIILIEECAEVQQRATKALRFGLKEVQPGQELDNGERIALEIGDLMEVVAMAEDAEIVHAYDILRGQENKRRQLAKYMQTAPSVDCNEGEK